MKRKWLVPMLSVALVLGACSKGEEKPPAAQGSVDDGEAAGGYGAIDHGVKDKGVGFNMAGDSIEEAENVPAEDEKSIRQAFDDYIDAFNEKDIDQYIALLSPNSESFNIEEERTLLGTMFEEYDINRKASDVTIVKYNGSEAQVFSTLKTKLKQIESGLTTNPTGRQVTVFTKEDGAWKVSAVHYIGDSESK